MKPMRKKWGVKEGDSFTSDQWVTKWNGMLSDYERLVPIMDLRAGRGGRIQHPWQVRASRFDDGTGSLLPWRLDVALGTINDAAPPIIYRAMNDPRGWKPKTPPADDSPIVERSMAEYDSPWILLTAPKPGTTAVASDQFVEVDDAARPSYFRTAAMWEKKLYRASIFLTDTPSQQVAIDFPPQYLGRLKKQLRLNGGRLPVTPVAVTGGLLELARVFLIRDPGEKDGSGDTILVQQKVFLCLWTELIVPIDPSGGADGDAAAANFVAGAEFDFWTA